MLGNCLLLALSGHQGRLGECPLLGVKRTSQTQAKANDETSQIAMDARRHCSMTISAPSAAPCRIKPAATAVQMAIPCLA